MAVVPDNFEVATANRAVGILIPKNAELDSHYLVALFNSPIGLRLIELSKRGGIQQRINLEDMANLKIPVPPIVVQAEIAERVETIYAEAKRLREEGAEILENAKSQVEAMILGDGSESKL